MRFCLTSIASFVLIISLSAQWEKVDTPFKPSVISAVDSNILWVFASAPIQIFKTLDNGHSWTGTNIPNATGFLLGNYISGIDSVKAWASFNHYSSGIRYVYRTQDGGQSWQPAKPEGLHDNQIIQFQQFKDFNNGILISWDISDSVFIHHTIDAGQSWTTKSLAITGSLLGITSYGEQHIWFYTSNGELWRSEDGGVNWSTFQTSLIATSYGLAMAFTDSLHGLAFKDHYYNQLYRTTDGGATWQTIVWSGNPPAENIYVWGATAIPDLYNAYIVGHNEGTVVTTDGGESWYVEHNYPDYAFGQPTFIGSSDGWGTQVSQTGLYRWRMLIDALESTCLSFTGPMQGKLRRSQCNDIWLEGQVPVDLTTDPDIHLNVQLFYPDYAPDPGNKYQIVKNLSTGCPDCKVQFIPDSGQVSVGTLHFDIPVSFALDTTDEVICTLSPTQCLGDTVQSFPFHTGYFANWFHEECFQIDSSDCAVELLTNVCGFDTNQYLIYYQVGVEPLKLGNRYEKDPSFNDPVFFYIYAYGDASNSTCYEVIQTLYNCGTSGSNNPHTAVSSGFHIWPNPANEHIYFDMSTPSPEGLMLRISNSIGRIIYNKALAPQLSAPLDISSLESGIYFLELYSQSRHWGKVQLVVD